MLIRPAIAADGDAIWAIMEPIVRGGETYTLPREMDKSAALAYWRSAEHDVFVAEENGEITGTCFLQANQKGGGSRIHDGACGYGPRGGTSDVCAFDGTCTHARIPCDAV